MAKTRIAVIFGGRSGEHEVSLMSAESVMAALDPERYEVIPVGITRLGQWVLVSDALALARAGRLPEYLSNGAPVGGSVELIPDPTTRQGIDVAFPVLHGTFGEDGTVQGLLELAGIPYVGAGVGSSAVSMDKAFMRVLFAHAGLPMAAWMAVERWRWEIYPESVIQEIEGALAYPCFVKPANLGSSVGVSKARNRDELAAALTSAADYDRKLVIEEAVDRPREIECSVLGNHELRASVPGEIIPDGEFYDYAAKYETGRSQLLIPAPLDEEQRIAVQDYALRAFRAVDCAGMARVDFFLDSDERLLINEINTIPGFTAISMYPKLWEASGLPFADLVDTLVQLALERHADRGRSRTEL